MTDDEKFDQLMAKVDTLIELHHEILSRPQPEHRHTVNIPAWSRAQIERVITIYLEIRDKIAKGR